MRTKKCCWFCTFLFCCIPIFTFLVVLVICKLQAEGRISTSVVISRSGTCSYMKCAGRFLDPPFGVIGSYCGSPFLQLKCFDNYSNGTVGYWQPNNTPTDILVTSVRSSRSDDGHVSGSDEDVKNRWSSGDLNMWGSGDLSIVPHPSMSNCSHIQRANIPSLFDNLRLLPQFHLHAMRSSSLLFFNCLKPKAVREDEYPAGFSRGGEACNRFTRSCRLKSNSTSMDCFQLSKIKANSSSKTTEALISRLGCTSFTSSYEKYRENEDLEKSRPATLDYAFRVGWKKLQDDILCDSLGKSCCGYFPNGTLNTYCQYLRDQKIRFFGAIILDTSTYPPGYHWTYRELFLQSLVISSYIIFVVLFISCVVKRKGMMLWLTGETYFKVQDLHEPPKNMSYMLLDWATRSFSNKIGEGGCGQVYAGILPRHHTPLAVKVLDNARHSHAQFVAEVASIGNLHHLNLVRLIGFCSHKSKRLLVYEYIPNGSLDTHLFYSPNQIMSINGLTWERRCSIILGVARGLAYLHHECRQQVVHLDIKPSNVLLDLEFNPKIADFGLAKLMNMNQSKAQTIIRGTLGYMAPELWKDSIVSTKCDVYSFGVLIIEVIAGKKLLQMHALNSQIYSINSTFEEATEEDFLPLVDERVACTEIMAQARNLILVSMWCIQEDPCLRPSMIKVIDFIEGKDLVPSNPPNPFQST